jgi:hypothetical protein
LFLNKPNGDDLAVTSENKTKFIELYLKWYTESSIENQFRPFYRGFKKIVQNDLKHVGNIHGVSITLHFFNQLFRAEELHSLICGSAKLDFFELEKHTKYEEPFSKDHPVIK